MKLTKELFHDVVAFVFSEPGAMGCAGTIRFLRANGQSFFIDYLEGNTWSLLKETFSGVKEAVFNGPNPLTPYVANVFALGGSPDDPKPKNAEGWHEIAFDCGNHMSVRREYARGFINLFAGKEPTEIILDGFDIIRKEGRWGGWRNLQTLTINRNSGIRNSQNGLQNGMPQRITRKKWIKQTVREGWKESFRC